MRYIFNAISCKIKKQPFIDIFHAKTLYCEKTKWLALFYCSCLHITDSDVFFPIEMVQYNQQYMAASAAPYRIITAHLTHANVFHFTMNISALLIIGLLHSHYYKHWHWLVAFFILSVSISIGLYQFDRDIDIYYGLSGVLHGFIVIGAIADVLHKMRGGTILLYIVAIKLLAEQFSSPNFTLEILIESYIAINAHLIGAVIGVGLGLMMPYLTQVKKML